RRRRPSIVVAVRADWNRSPGSIQMTPIRSISTRPRTARACRNFCTTADSGRSVASRITAVPRSMATLLRRAALLRRERGLRSNKVVGPAWHGKNESNRMIRRGGRRRQPERGRTARGCYRGNLGEGRACKERRPSEVADDLAAVIRGERLQDGRGGRVADEPH